MQLLQRKRILFLVLLIVVLAFVGFTFFTNGQDEPEEPRVGKISPNFRLPDLSGRMVELKAVYPKNRVTLVNFWATWCGPCRVEIPEFNRIYQEYRGKGLEILAVNTWDESKPESIKTFVEQAKMEFPILLDTEWKVATQYGVRGIPTTVIIGPTGHIQEIIVGMTTYQRLKERLEKLL